MMAGDPGAIKNTKREARGPAHVNLVGGQASGGADRTICCRRTPRAAAAHPNRLKRSLTTISGIWAIIWLTRSTPPFPLGW